MKNIVPNENCLTEVQLLRYLHDECATNEEKAIDSHLTHCPMCSDALEGAMLLNAARLERSLKHLDAKIDTQFSDKTKVVEMAQPVMRVVKSPKKRGWLWAAASIAVLFAVGLWIVTKPFESQMKEATVASIDSLPTNNQETIQTDLATQTDVAQAEALKKQGETAANNGTSSAQKPMTTEKDVASVNANKVNTPTNDLAKSAATSPQQSDVAVAIPKPIYTDENSREGDGEAFKEVVVAKPSKAKAEEAKMNDLAVADTYKKATTKDKQTRQAPAPSSTNNYPGAAAQNMGESPSTTRAKQTIENAFTDYQLGMQFYTKGQYNEAIAQLNRVLAKQNKGELYENATWYLANSYLKLGKTQDARTLLQRIVAEKGKYATQAATLLK